MVISSYSLCGFTSWLNGFSYRLGLSDSRLRRIYQSCASLDVSFMQHKRLDRSIWWPNSGLVRLASLPRCALSGPVQEDKAAAFDVLSSLISKTYERFENIDLRSVDGLAGTPCAPFTHLEDFVASERCRAFRIISYQDFERVIHLALPGFSSSESILLLSADWFPGRLFWSGEQQREALASAVVYARRRGLCIGLPAQVLHYRINQVGLELLRSQYHALWIPSKVWTMHAFMQLLLESDMPYARLSLLHEACQEVLLLSRKSRRSNALGLGLRKAGAFDATDWLAHLVADQAI